VKVAVLVSGGVDSSVALARLKEQGYELTAFYLKIWLEDELSFLGECPWEEDLRYARAVCEQLEVPLEVLSLQREYHDTVVTYTIDQVKAGRTPNPDVLCNTRVKFGFFLQQVADRFDAIATGHYAQVVHEDGRVRLHQAPDAVKDQTYFLSHLTQAQLAKALFPIGDLRKEQVRALAKQYGLATCDRKDSQGICFLGKLKFREFLKFHVGERSGELREHETDHVLGSHSGFWFYTIGQRQGIGLSGGPWYVVRKDTDANRVYISRQYYEPDKARDSFAVTDCNWIGQQPKDGEQLRVKVRHGAHSHTCSVRHVGDSLLVQLDERDQGLAPGQFAVFYRGDECLGGGMIADCTKRERVGDSQVPPRVLP